MICRNTSPTPNGLTPGDLSKGINWPATNLSMLVLQKLACSPEGPCEPLVLIAHFLTESPFTPSNIISFTLLKGSYKWCHLMVLYQGLFDVSLRLKAAKFHC